MVIREVNDAEQWDDLVSRARGGTVFHTSRWTSQLRRAIVRLGAFKGDTLVAGILAFDNETSPNPRDTITPYQGPLIAPHEKKALTPAEIYRLMLPLTRAIKERIPNVKFVTSPWLESLGTFMEEGYEARLLYTYLLTMPCADSAWASFSSGLRSNIRSAQKAGLVADETVSSDELLLLVAQSFARQNMRLWFDREEAVDCLSNLAETHQVRVFITRKPDATPVAAVAAVRDERRSYYVLGGYDHTSAHRGATSLAMWAAIQFAYSQWGLSEFDFEGSYLPFVARFFRQFANEFRSFYFVTEATRPLY